MSEIERVARMPPHLFAERGRNFVCCVYMHEYGIRHTHTLSLLRECLRIYLLRGGARVRNSTRERKGARERARERETARKRGKEGGRERKREYA